MHMLYIVRFLIAAVSTILQVADYHVIGKIYSHTVDVRNLEKGSPIVSPIP